MRMVADLGGTNVRFGIVSDSTPNPRHVRKYSNDCCQDFDTAMAGYWENLGQPDIDEIVVAAAAPVTGRTARLTNRSWTVDADRISARFGGIRVTLLNDLQALGHAIPFLGSIDVLPLTPPRDLPGINQQALVVGVGTGFNVSPVMFAGNKAFCAAAEYGHVPLPTDIAAHVGRRLPSLAGLSTVEDCFSGRGFARLEAEWDRNQAGSGSNANAARAAFHLFYAELLALLSRSLFLSFVPAQGMYFAGSVARAVLQSSAANHFVECLDKPFAPPGDLKATVSLIVTDSAALYGCAAIDMAA